MEQLETYMKQYRKELVERCEAGIRGEEKADVNIITLALTNQCNIHCVMCPFISKDSENRTYFNAPPRMVTLDEIKELLEHSGIGSTVSEYIKIDITNGESFLNPQIFDILKYIKEKFPKSEVKILTNGTIPPIRPEIVKYIDILAFSLDGGTREVFEKIRTPSRFDHVIETIKKWLAARNEYHPNMRLRTSTTLSTLNMEDLPNIVSLVGNIVGELGGTWDSIYCQPVVIESYQDNWLKEITMEHIDRKAGKKILQETVRLAESYQIRLDIPEAVYKVFDEEAKPEIRNSSEREGTVCRQALCTKLSNGGMAFDVDCKLKYACCFMDKEVWRKLLVEYDIISMKDKNMSGSCNGEGQFSYDNEKKLDELYNCPGYWRLRKDLLEGKLKNACRDCIIGKSDYYTAVENMKKIIEMDR